MQIIMRVPRIGGYRISRAPESDLFIATNPVLTASRIAPLRAEYFDVLLNFGSEQRKACKVQLRNQGGDLAAYVHLLPSFGHSFGRLRRVELHGPAGAPESVAFSDGGTTTTQIVKYNHPGDGRAHFSGNVRPLFTQSTPLREVSGHLFSLHFWGADGFRLAGAKEARPPTDRRATVNFHVGTEHGAAETAGRIVGWCYPRGALPWLGLLDLGPNPTEPATWTVDNGEARPTLIIAPPCPEPDDDLVMLLSYHPMDISTGPGYPVLVFLGGWDTSHDQTRPDSYSNFLALKYAKQDDDFEDMVRLSGSIDYAPKVSSGEMEGAA